MSRRNTSKNGPALMICAACPQEKPQIHGQKKHLSEKQQRRGGKKKPCVSTPEVGKDDNVVNAGRKQNEVHSK